MGYYPFQLHPKWGKKTEKGKKDPKFYQAFCLACFPATKPLMMPFAEWKTKSKGTSSVDVDESTLTKLMAAVASTKCSGGSAGNMLNHIKIKHKALYAEMNPPSLKDAGPT